MQPLVQWLADLETATRRDLAEEVRRESDESRRKAEAAQREAEAVRRAADAARREAEAAQDSAEAARRDAEAEAARQADRAAAAEAKLALLADIGERITHLVSDGRSDRASEPDGPAATNGRPSPAPSSGATWGPELRDELRVELRELFNTQEQAINLARDTVERILAVVHEVAPGAVPPTPAPVGPSPESLMDWPPPEPGSNGAGHPGPPAPQSVVDVAPVAPALLPPPAWPPTSPDRAEHNRAAVEEGDEWDRSDRRDWESGDLADLRDAFYSATPLEDLWPPMSPEGIDLRDQDLARFQDDFSAERRRDRVGRAWPFRASSRSVSTAD
jgi:hypothetical protein